MISNKSKLIEILEDLFRLDSSGHDLTHLIRTANLAIHLQKKEGGDPEIIEAAALLHDVHRIIEKETGKFCEPIDSLPKIREILKQIEFDKRKIDNILHAIEHHEEYSFSEGKNTNTIEALILQDADNLDAMGAVGIARAFSFGGANSCPIYDPKAPLKRTEYRESQLDPSEVHHIHNKLLRLKENMNTKTAMKMAKNRHIFMEKYLNQFLAEWSGER